MENLEANNTRLQGEIAALRNQITMNEISISQLAEGKNFETEKNKGKIERLENELMDAKSETNKKVSETTQFQQMMKLMKSQAVTIKELRKKLQVYEPEKESQEED
jgi:hypothetical protein